MLDTVNIFPERSSQKGSRIIQLARSRKSEMNAKSLSEEGKIHKKATKRNTSSQPDFNSSYLLEPARSAFTLYEIGIFGTWISCITAQTMVRQLVSVVKESI
jgi:hypothetical protein